MGNAASDHPNLTELLQGEFPLRWIVGPQASSLKLTRYILKPTPTAGRHAPCMLYDDRAHHRQKRLRHL